MVHASPAPPRPPPGAAVVVGPPRTAAQIKDCAWATTRRPLEARLPPPCCEGLLCSPTGELTEGLVTNLFIVDAHGIVHTAPVGQVLGGVVRHQVLQTCALLGVPVVESAPVWHARDGWVAGFVTNAARGVQPLTSVTLPDGCDWVAAPVAGTVSMAPDNDVVCAIAKSLEPHYTLLDELQP